MRLYQRPTIVRNIFSSDIFGIERRGEHAEGSHRGYGIYQVQGHVNLANASNTFPEAYARI